MPLNILSELDHMHPILMTVSVCVCADVYQGGTGEKGDMGCHKLAQARETAKKWN